MTRRGSQGPREAKTPEHILKSVIPAEVPRRIQIIMYDRELIEGLRAGAGALGGDIK
jgi:hypothetical protein